MKKLQNYSKTPNGNIYFTSPVVLPIAQTAPVEMFSENIKTYISSFPEELGFEDYLIDLENDADQISMFAGQVCYQSHSKARTKTKDTDKYFENIHASRHLSVIEHISVSFLIYGISRNLSAEMNRHRHISPSEKSQRYCDGKTLRFVERPEFQNDKYLHTIFENHVDCCVEVYDQIASRLLDSVDENLPRTEKRKKVNQVARAVLPGCTETVCVYTGNLRAWDNYCNLRMSPHAEVEIRQVANQINNYLSEQFVAFPKRSIL